MLEELKIDMADVFQRCQDRLNSFNRRKKAYQFLRRTELFFRLIFSSFYMHLLNCYTFFFTCNSFAVKKLPSYRFSFFAARPALL